MVVLTDNALDDWPELNNVIKIPDPLPFRLDAKSFLSQKRVISIGRYEFDKGNDLLLCVWAEVEKQMPEWHLDIYGDGFREPFQRLMGQLGIDTSHCHLFGPTSDVKQEYLNSSVFVLPSRFEGFGLVLIEAMACGVPVVSFDCENGPRSIITDGVDGFLISPFDVEAFAEKVIMLMKDEELRREKSNVHISSLCPGPTASKFFDRAGVSFSVKPMQCDKVAKYGIDKMFKGKAIIVPGFINKCSIFLKVKELSSSLLVISHKPVIAFIGVDS